MIKLIIGLGNPGKEYEKTRHNIGFMLVDKLAKKLSADSWTDDKRFESSVAKAKLDGETIILAKPLTFMNKSGEAVWRLMSYYKIDAREVLAVVDDLNLELGKIRLRLGGTNGGHNGLRSVIEKADETFWRWRIGIGFNEKVPAEDYVLGKIPPHEIKEIDRSIDKSVDLLLESSIKSPEEITVS
jgi:PTH1 family peptidyl-tRNA hydrolase